MNGNFVAELERQASFQRLEIKGGKRKGVTACCPGVSSKTGKGRDGEKRKLVFGTTIWQDLTRGGKTKR